MPLSYRTWYSCPASVEKSACLSHSRTGIVARVAGVFSFIVTGVSSESTNGRSELVLNWGLGIPYSTMYAWEISYTDVEPAGMGLLVDTCGCGWALYKPVI